MDDEPRPLTEAQILEAHQQGVLGKALSERAWRDKEALLTELLVSLHNSGQLDLVEVGTGPSVAGLPTHTFFGAQHIFVEAIPRLHSELEPMMELVAVLVEQGGRDGMAYRPNGAFRKWCEQDLDRARSVVSRAERGEPLAIRFLGLALEVLGDLAQMRRLATDYDGERRKFAITALGLAAHPDTEEQESSRLVLATIAERDTADEIIAAILMAVCRIFADTPTTITDLLRTALDVGGEQTLHAATQILWNDERALDDDVVRLLLAALMRVPPANLGTINILDYGLFSLIKHGRAELALQFLTDFLIQSELDIEHFDSTFRGLTEGPNGHLNEVIVRWLLSGEIPLCEALASELRGESLQGQAVAIDFQPFALTTVQVLFICRKAIGYFFVQPVTAGSVVVSALRTAEGGLKTDLENMLFDPLLRNYGGELRDFLESVAEPDPAYQSVRTALARHDRYIDGLKSVPEIKEFHPPEHRLLMERFRNADETRQAMKRANKKSVLLDLVKKSVVLYGLKTLSYMQGPSGERRPVEMELKSFGVTHEWPRMETTDPVRLDEMLKHFRLEQFVA